MASRRAEQQIAHLLARQQQVPILEKKTRLPYGWALWLRALPPLPRPGHAREIVAVLLPRPQPPAEAPRPPLGRLRAMRQLLWQGWDPPPRDQRGLRWAAAAISALLHLLFFLGLLWIALISLPVPPDGGDGQGERVQVAFLGQGARDGGGQVAPGAQPAAAATSAAPPSPAAAAPAPAPVEPAAPPPTPAEPAPAEPASAPPTSQPSAADAPAAAAPPIQATDVAQATHEFIVPPVSVPRTQVSVVPRVPSTDVREREIRPVQPPSLTVPPMPAPPSATLAVQAPQVQVRERAVVPLPPLETPSPVVPAPQVTVQLPPRDVQVRERSVRPLTDVPAPVAQAAAPLTAPEPAPAPLPQVRERRIAERAPAATAATANAAAANAAGSAAAEAARTSPPSAAPAARPAADPGNWATPARGDDWGASARSRQGSQNGSRTAAAGQGMFDGDGRVRVPGEQGPAASPRGAPGGDNDGWSRDRIAQSGTWLKRPPYDYTPTSFDKYWVPNESLLAEWVRKGVKAIEIPLPGTGTRISCVISLLQVGGGCGLSDPNMQDQPAHARPPPDVPFKPELQEDNGSR